MNLKAEDIVVRRVNGMGESDPNGSYLALIVIALSENKIERHVFRISEGQAETLITEMQGLLP